MKYIRFHRFLANIQSYKRQWKQIINKQQGRRKTYKINRFFYVKLY